MVPTDTNHQRRPVATTLNFLQANKHFWWPVKRYQQVQ